MEVRLDALNWADAPIDTFVSVRVGANQKQSRIAASRVIHFQDPGDGRGGYAKVEVFRRIGSASISFDNFEGKLQDAQIPCKDLDFPLLNLSISADSTSVDPDYGEKRQVQKGKKVRQRLDEAQQYMKEHQLEDVISDSLRDVIREKPSDPHQYLCNQIMKRSILPPITMEKTLPPLPLGEAGKPKSLATQQQEEKPSETAPRSAQDEAGDSSAQSSSAVCPNQDARRDLVNKIVEIHTRKMDDAHAANKMASDMACPLVDHASAQVMMDIPSESMTAPAVSPEAPASAELQTQSAGEAAVDAVEHHPVTAVDGQLAAADVARSPEPLETGVPPETAETGEPLVNVSTALAEEPKTEPSGLEFHFHELNLDEVDQTLFKKEFMDCLGKLGATSALAGQLDVQLRAGSIIATVCGPLSAMQDLRKLPLDGNMSVMGSTAKISEVATSASRAGSKAEGHTASEVAVAIAAAHLAVADTVAAAETAVGTAAGAPVDAEEPHDLVGEAPEVAQKTAEPVEAVAEVEEAAEPKAAESDRTGPAASEVEKQGEVLVESCVAQEAAPDAADADACPPAPPGPEVEKPTESELENADVTQAKAALPEAAKASDVVAEVEAVADDADVAEAKTVAPEAGKAGDVMAEAGEAPPALESAKASEAVAQNADLVEIKVAVPETGKCNDGVPEDAEAPPALAPETEKALEKGNGDVEDKELRAFALSTFLDASDGKLEEVFREMNTEKPATEAAKASDAAAEAEAPPAEEAAKPSEAVAEEIKTEKPAPDDMKASDVVAEAEAPAVVEATKPTEPVAEEADVTETKVAASEAGKPSDVVTDAVEATPSEAAKPSEAVADDAELRAFALSTFLDASDGQLEEVFREMNSEKPTPEAAKASDAAAGAEAPPVVEAAEPSEAVAEKADVTEAKAAAPEAAKTDDAEALPVVETAKPSEAVAEEADVAEIKVAEAEVAETKVAASEAAKPSDVADAVEATPASESAKPSEAVADDAELRAFALSTFLDASDGQLEEVFREMNSEKPAPEAAKASDAAAEAEAPPVVEAAEPSEAVAEKADVTETKVAASEGVEANDAAPEISKGKDGVPEDAEAPPAPQTKAAIVSEDEALRAFAKSTFLDAMADGQLDEVFAEVKTEKPAPVHENEEMYAKVRDTFSASAKDGRLQSALKDIIKSKAEKTPEAAEEPVASEIARPSEPAAVDADVADAKAAVPEVQKASDVSVEAVEAPPSVETEKPNVAVIEEAPPSVEMEKPNEAVIEEADAAEAKAAAPEAGKTSDIVAEAAEAPPALEHDEASEAVAGEVRDAEAQDAVPETGKSLDVMAEGVEAGKSSDIVPETAEALPAVDAETPTEVVAQDADVTEAKDVAPEAGKAGDVMAEAAEVLPATEPEKPREAEAEIADVSDAKAAAVEVAGDTPTTAASSTLQAQEAPTREDAGHPGTSEAVIAEDAPYDHIGQQAVTVEDAPVEEVAGEDVKAMCRGMLQRSFESGELQLALDRINQDAESQPVERQSVDPDAFLKARVYGQMVRACETGEIDQVVQAVFHGTSDSQAPPSVEAEKPTEAVIEEADAVEAKAAAPEAEKTSDAVVETAEARIYGQMVRACETGEIDQVVQAAFSGTSDPQDSDSAKQYPSRPTTPVRDLPSVNTWTKRLPQRPESAEDVQAPSAEAEDNLPTQVKEARVHVRGLLTGAIHSGALDAALATVHADKAPPSVETEKPKEAVIEEADAVEAKAAAPEAGKTSDVVAETAEADAQEAPIADASAAPRRRVSINEDENAQPLPGRRSSLRKGTGYVFKDDLPPSSDDDEEKEAKATSATEELAPDAKQAATSATDEPAPQAQLPPTQPPQPPPPTSQQIAAMIDEKVGLKFESLALRLEKQFDDKLNRLLEALNAKKAS